MKKIKYLFFFILFLSFCKGVHADSLGCYFALFNVYNSATETYDDWHLTEEYNIRNGPTSLDDSVGTATVERIGSNCISIFNMTSTYYNNNFYGYVIGFYNNGKGSRIFSSPGEEKVFKLFLTNTYYNALKSGYFKIDVYDTSTTTTKRTQLKYKYTDYCKTNTNQVGDISFTIECNFPYTFTQDSYLTFYPTNTALTLYNTGLAYRIDTNYDNINDSINDMTDKITQEQDKTNQKLDDINNSITNDNVDTSINKANDFFSGFTTDTFGLTSIITSPLNLIASITSSSCSPLPLQVPFLENTTFNLPCMSSIYQEHFGSFLTIYQTITFGITAYWVCIKIFALVKSFKDPESDKIEVLDL